MQHERASLLVAPHPEGGAADAKRKPPAARAPAENAKRGKSAAAAAKPTAAAVSSEPSELPAKHPEAADEVRSPARFASQLSVFVAPLPGPWHQRQYQRKETQNTGGSAATAALPPPTDTDVVHAYRRGRRLRDRLQSPRPARPRTPRAVQDRVASAQRVRVSPSVVARGWGVRTRGRGEGTWRRRDVASARRRYVGQMQQCCADARHEAAEEDGLLGALHEEARRATVSAVRVRPTVRTRPRLESPGVAPLRRASLTLLRAGARAMGQPPRQRRAPAGASRARCAAARAAVE